MINKRKEKKEELAKDKTWKAVGASDKIFKLFITKFESRRRRKKEDVECLQFEEEWEKLKKNKRNWESVREFVGLNC